MKSVIRTVMTCLFEDRYMYKTWLVFHHPEDLTCDLVYSSEREEDETVTGHQASHLPVIASDTSVLHHSNFLQIPQLPEKTKSQRTGNARMLTNRTSRKWSSRSKSWKY